MTACRSILTALTLSLSASAAMGFCYEPSAPSCASGYGRFSDEWEFRSCRSDMERHKGELDEYRECLIREVRQKVERATEDFNSAVSRFNSRANSQ